MYPAKKKEISQYVIRDMEIIHKYLNLEFGFNILDGGRKRIFVDARRVFVQILQAKYNFKAGKAYKLLTLQDVADYMNYPNHSSIIWLLRNWDTFISWEPRYQEIYAKILRKVEDNYNIKRNSLLDQKKVFENDLLLINLQLKQLESEQEESNSQNS